MLNYFLKRIVVSFPTLLGISVLCFFLVQIMPGGPVEMQLAQWKSAGVGGGEAGGGGRMAQITEEARENLVKYYGFDKPIGVRYFHWMGRLLRLDFGDSYSYDRPVLELIRECMPVSISFGLFSMLATYLICIPLGIRKALKHNSAFDIVTSGIIFLLYSIPSFAFGILLIVLFGGGSFWNVFPIQGMWSENFDTLSFWGKFKDYAHHMFLPLLCYTIGSFATLTMLMKNSLLDQLKQDYIVTARAKGLTEKMVIWRHAFRNALLPIANGLGQWISFFFAGSILIESIFGLNGLGKLTYEAVVRRDYPIVLADIMIVACLHIIGNLISDYLYVLIDPRIDYR